MARLQVRIFDAARTAGRDEKPGKRRVGLLLKCMGFNAIKVYDTFE